MPLLYVYSDLPAVDRSFADAVADLTDETDVLLLETWMARPKSTEATAGAPEQFGRIVIETELARGRFGLCICLSGWGVPTRFTKAELTRRLAIRIRRPLLHSDCSPSGRTWFMFEPTGAIYHVISGYDVDDMDLVEPPTLVWARHENLPDKSTDRPDDLTAEDRLTCGQQDERKLCEVFRGACPVYRNSSDGSACPRRP